MPPDPDDVLALVIACALTLLIFNAAGALAVWLLWRFARRRAARLPTQAPRDPLAPLFYALSFVFLPASFALCVAFLPNPAKSRMGAMCATFGIAQVMVIAWAVCALMAVYAPEIVPYLP